MFGLIQQSELKITLLSWRFFFFTISLTWKELSVRRLAYLPKLHQTWGVDPRPDTSLIPSVHSILLVESFTLMILGLAWIVGIMVQSYSRNFMRDYAINANSYYRFLYLCLTIVLISSLHFIKQYSIILVLSEMAQQ